MICQIGHIEESYQVAEDSARLVLNRAFATMAADLVNRVRKGKVTPRNLEGQRRSQPRKRKEMVAEMEEALTVAADRGKVDYAAEIERQKVVIADGDA